MKSSILITGSPLIIAMRPPATIMLFAPFMIHIASPCSSATMTATSLTTVPKIEAGEINVGAFVRVFTALGHMGGKGEAGRIAALATIALGNSLEDLVGLHAC